MKEKIKISVIIPVYNVEPWIGECIESLKKQRLDGLEFIIVDDCSTDGSLGIIEDFAREDSRVRIIRNEVNSGSGLTRNAGIDAARGEYLSFIDPDDWISDKFYENLYAKAKETGCDIVKGVRVRFEDGCTKDEIYKIPLDIVLNNRIKKRKTTKLPLFRCFTYEHQSAIYRAALFEDESVRYGTSRNAQDTTFLFKICHNTESIAIISDSTYYYRLRRGAATSEYTKKRLWNEMVALEEIIDYVKTKPHDVTHVGFVAMRMQSLLSSYYYAMQNESISDRDADAIYKRFMKVAEYIQNDDMLYSEHPEIQIFMKYKYAIPRSAKLGKLMFKEGLERWTDFFLQHHDGLERWQYNGYAGTLVASLAKFYRTGRNKRKAYDIDLGFYKNQLSRLPKKERMIVMKRLFRAFLGKLKRKIRG